MLTSDNPIFMDVIEGRFSTPSGNYFWHRKYRKVEQLVRRAARQLPVGNDQHLFVDVGCGQGIDLFRIRDVLPESSWQLKGIDADPTALHLCRLKKEALNANNVEIMASDITQPLPLQDDSVDILYCSEVIEHLVQPETLLAEFRRVLKKPGGYLLLTTPNEPNLLQRTFWDPARRRRFQKEMLALRNQTRSVQTPEENTFLFGHVSLKTITEWDRLLNGMGFATMRHERGAMVYGGTDFLDQEWVLGVRFLAEGILDLLPATLSRHCSDQLIALYRIR